MKHLLYLILFSPLFFIAQDSNAQAKGYQIDGAITGYADGTPVSFLNDESGQPEQVTTIQKDHFEIKGTVNQPTFKVLVFGNQPPAVPIFVENSLINFKGDKSTIAQATITGSPTHEVYKKYMVQLQPFTPLFSDPSHSDTASIRSFEKIVQKFISENPSSYVAPIALLQFMQVTHNTAMAEDLYKKLNNKIQQSSLAIYAKNQINEAKINAIGSVVPEFSQMDTSGKKISITSLRGKYVLIDFWASWCRPCREENPNVVNAYKKYASKNFTVLGVSLDQAKPAWISAIKMDGLTWTHISDLKGWQNDVAGMFHITSIPQNLLIDPQGKIIAKNLRGEALDNKLESLLK
ncbi:MAG: TlpA disulfide reductase family protein [Ginsengibacter sp.]